MTIGPKQLAEAIYYWSKQTDWSFIPSYKELVLEAAKAHLAHLETDGWLPIESAPRRIPFIATGKTETPCVVTTTAPETKKAGYPFCCYHTQVCFHESKFTHWMPLPAAPRSELLCSQSKELCSSKGETK